MLLKGEFVFRVEKQGCELLHLVFSTLSLTSLARIKEESEENRQSFLAG